MAGRRHIRSLRRGEIGPEPIPVRDPAAGARTGRRLVLRVMTSAPRLTVPAAGALVLHQIGEALVPVIMGGAIDSAILADDVGALFLWLGVLAADFALLSFSYRYGSWLGQLGAESIQHRLRVSVASRLLHPRARADRLPGAALSLATNDVQRLTHSVALLVYPIGELAAVLFGGALLLLQWPPLGLAVLIGAPAILLMVDLAGRRLRTRAEGEADAVADAAGQAADIIAGYRVVKGIHAEDVARERYRRVSQRALRASLSARGAEAGLTAGLEIATGLFIVAIAGLAGLAAAAGYLTVGQLIAIVGLTQFLMGPLRAFATNAAPIWSAAQASAARVLPPDRREDGSGGGAGR